MADGNILSGTQQAPIGSDKAYHTDGALDLFHTFAQLLTYIESNLSAVQNDIIPSADNTTSIGSAAKRIKDIFQAGSIKDSSGNELLSFSPTAAAVNEITLKNAATGNGPEIQATGGDTNIDIKLVSKGTGNIIPNAPIVSDTDNTNDLGTRAKRWKNIALSGNLLLGTNAVTLTIAENNPGIDSNVKIITNSGILKLNGSFDIVRDGGNLSPIFDNAQDLGSSTSQFKNIYINTGLRFGNIKIVGAQQAAVADASGGAVIDTECRAQLNSLLAKLRTHGLIAT